MDDQELRRWAVEQVIAARPSDCHMDATWLAAEASRLFDYVRDGASVRMMSALDHAIASTAKGAQ